ncbi:MAG: T9SS type A sorting domain-containing protein [Hymenobacteraceae bacterium]|nr:T9SS type A sorting domain-containing protein [Hymenobacteraceae bacterium]
MQKLLLAAALLVLAAYSAAAQTVFAPAGAEWWYEVTTVGGPYMLRVYTAGDAVLSGKAGRWQALDTQYFGYAGNGAYFPQGQVAHFAYTQVRNNQVWTATDSTESVFLDFSSGPGIVDSVANGCARRNSAHRIDSLGVRTVSGQSARIQWHHAFARTGVVNDTISNALRQYTGEVVERLGYENAVLFPQPECGTDPEQPTLRFYSDGIVSVGTRPQIVTGLAEASATRALQFAPNPSATGRFCLVGQVIFPINYTVCDALGRRVCSGQLTAAAPEIILPNVAPGLYLLRGEAGGQAFARRLVRP